MRTQLLIIAKAPVPGRVKTRLCPPCTARQAADIAAAALTVAALRGRGLRVDFGAALRDVDSAPDAWEVAAQCPDGTFAAAVRRHIPLAVTR